MYEIEFFDKSKKRLGKVVALSVAITDSLNKESIAIAKVPTIMKVSASEKSIISPAVELGFYNEWNSVNIYIVRDSGLGAKERVLIFCGYIRNSDDESYFSVLEIVDMWGYSELKKLPEQSFNSTGTNLLSWAVTQINSINDSGITFESFTNKEIETKIEFGNSLNDVLSRLVESGFEVGFDGTKILLGEFIGRDRTGSDGITLRSLYKTPDNSNVLPPEKVKRVGLERANTVYFKYENGVGIERGSSIEDEIAVFRDFSDTNFVDSQARATEIINSNGESDKEIELIPSINKIKIGEVKKGDLIMVKIENLNPLLAVESTFRVIEIKLDSKKPNSITKITIGNTKLREYGENYLLKEIRRIQARI